MLETGSAEWRLGLGVYVALNGVPIADLDTAHPSARIPPEHGDLRSAELDAQARRMEPTTCIAWVPHRDNANAPNPQGLRGVARLRHEKTIRRVAISP
ncbi:MAG: hypothetical protein ACO38W_11235, partial [Phycisphaerales bacterium]